MYFHQTESNFGSERASLTIVIWRTLRVAIRSSERVVCDFLHATHSTPFVQCELKNSHTYMSEYRIDGCTKPHRMDYMLIITVLLSFIARLRVFWYLFTKNVCIDALNTRFSFVAFFSLFSNKYWYLHYHLLSYWLNHVNWRIPTNESIMIQFNHFNCKFSSFK